MSAIRLPTKLMDVTSSMSKKGSRRGIRRGYRRGLKGVQYGVQIKGSTFCNNP